MNFSSNFDVPMEMDVDLSDVTMVDVLNHPDSYSNQLLNWTMPLYWWFLGQRDRNHDNLDPTSGLQPLHNIFHYAQNSDLPASPPPIAELMQTKIFVQLPIRAEYTITPANITREEWLEESYRARERGSIAKPCEQQCLPVAPRFDRPPLLGERLKRRSGRTRSRKSTRMVPVKSPAAPSTAEARNLRLLRLEREANRRRLEDEADRQQRSAERHRSTCRKRYEYAEPDSYSSSSSSSHSSSSFSTPSRPLAERWPSQSDSSEGSEDDSSSEISESSDSSAERSTWASGSSSDSQVHSRGGLSPPPRRSERLMRIHQYQLSRETQSRRPWIFQTMMNTVTNLWPGA